MLTLSHGEEDSLAAAADGLVPRDVKLSSFFHSIFDASSHFSPGTLADKRCAHMQLFSSTELLAWQNYKFSVEPRLKYFLSQYLATERTSGVSQ